MKCPFKVDKVRKPVKFYEGYLSWLNKINNIKLIVFQCHEFVIIFWYNLDIRSRHEWEMQRRENERWQNWNDRQYIENLSHDQLIAQIAQDVVLLFLDE